MLLYTSPYGSSCHAASVDVGGWNFTADLGDQWLLGTQPIEEGSRSGSTMSNYEVADYTGVMKSNAFWLPKDNTVITPQDSDSSGVDILVNKVPKERKDWAA